MKSFLKLNFFLSVLYILLFITFLSVAAYLFFLNREFISVRNEVVALETDLTSLNPVYKTLLDTKVNVTSVMNFTFYVALFVLLINLLVAILQKKKKYIILVILTVVTGSFTQFYQVNYLNRLNYTTFNDKNGVEIFGYGYQKEYFIGFQRNPLFVASQGLKHFEQYERDGSEKHLAIFYNTIDWLMENSTKEGDVTFFDYVFDYPPVGMKAPWRSALANSRVVMLLQKAHQQSGDQKYLDLANSCIRAFRVDSKDSGFRVVVNDKEWWYAEYPKVEKPYPFVLNGMISVVTSLDGYYQYCQDSSALELRNKGLTAIKEKLPEYDNDGASYYDLLGKPASKGYHLMHCAQLAQLYEMTHEQMYRDYEYKWRAYAKKKGWKNKK